MANFTLDSKFDIILCMYDSINHLEEYHDWIDTFRCAHKHLNPGGVFIFDMNTMEKLDRLSQSTGIKEHATGVYVFNQVSRIDKKTMKWNTKTFKRVRGNLYELGEDNITETAFPLQQVSMNLEAIFDKVHIRTFEEDPNLVRGRVFFICRV